MEGAEIPVGGAVQISTCTLLPFLCPSQGQRGMPAQGCRGLQNRENQPRCCQTQQRRTDPGPRRSASLQHVSSRKTQANQHMQQSKSLFFFSLWSGADVWLQADEHAYLVDAGKILDNEAEEDPGEQSPSHLQGASQQVEPGGALSQQRMQRTIK